MILKNNSETGADSSGNNEDTIFRKKRFPDGKADYFMRAWMMIRASGASGISFLTRKRLQKELQQYMKDLCLLDNVPQTPDEEEERIAEWKDFANTLFHSCLESKAYCSTFFGMIPVKDAAVAKKLAEEIDYVTRIYPAALSCEEAFLPFRNVMIQCYCEQIENGAAYWNEAAGR